MRRHKRYARDASFVKSRGVWIGMCGYTSVPEDGRTCYKLYEFYEWIDGHLLCNSENKLW